MQQPSRDRRGFRSQGEEVVLRARPWRHRSGEHLRIECSELHSSQRQFTSSTALGGGKNKMLVFLPPLGWLGLMLLAFCGRGNAACCVGLRGCWRCRHAKWHEHKGRHFKLCRQCFAQLGARYCHPSTVVLSRWPRACSPAMAVRGGPVRPPVRWRKSWGVQSVPGYARCGAEMRPRRSVANGCINELTTGV